VTIHVTPIPSTIELTTPAFVLGLTNTAGSSTSAVAANSTLLAFDGTLPSPNVVQSGATGSATVSARRDHVHSMAADPPDPSGLELVGTVEASASATLTVTGLDTTYDSFLILISQLHPTSNGYDLRFRVGDSSGVDSGAGDYGFICQTLLDSSASYASEVSSSATSILISDTGQGGPGTDTGEGFSAALWLFPGDGVVNPLVSGTYSYLDGGGGLIGGSVFGERTAIITLDRVEISLTSSTFASGRMSVYGYSIA